MNNERQGHTTVWLRSRSIGFSAMPAILLAAIPKCPLCWMALMSAVGAGSSISSSWLQPLTVALLLFSVSALFVRARRLRRYVPFSLGLLAAVAIYLCKFRFNYEVGVYLSAATLLVASIWNVLSEQPATDDARCRC